jgi:hypothetical protein
MAFMEAASEEQAKRATRAKMAIRDMLVDERRGKLDDNILNATTRGSSQENDSRVGHYNFLHQYTYSATPDHSWLEGSHQQFLTTHRQAGRPESSKGILTTHSQSASKCPIYPMDIELIIIHHFT